jgi:hypothetical protein
VASVAAGAAVVAAAGLATLGGVTLYHSTEGADAASGVPELVFPSTPTGAIAAVDESGALASVAIVVVQPSGAGGSIVTVPVSADSSNGKGPERLPIAETLALSGPEALESEVEAMLALGIDAFEVVDADRLTALLEGIGPIEVDLPADVTDAEADIVAEEGTATLDPAGAAAILTARDPSVPAIEQYPAATAVWSAVASAMTDSGTGAVAAASAGPLTIDALLSALSGGSAATRSLRAEPLDAERNPRGVDVSMLDQAEITLVFAQIAPGKVAAPNPGLTMRIEARFSDEQLEGTGFGSNNEVAYAAISSLLFVGGNVLSVNTEPGTAGEATVVELADETLAPATAGVDLLFGNLDVRVAETRIVGVDALLRLGTDYLELISDE